MSLQQRIADDLKASMKDRDKARTSALRMALAALKNDAVAKGRGPQGELSDEEVQAVLASEVKKRREAADSYRDAGREEQAASEEAEAEVYAEYLPEPFGEAELEALVDEVIAETGASGPQDLGTVMKTIMPRVGSRAAGGDVNRVVRAKLAG